MKKYVIPPYPTLRPEHLISVMITHSNNGDKLKEKTLPDGTISLRLEGHPWMVQQHSLSISVELDEDVFGRLIRDTEKLLPPGATAGLALAWHSKGSLRSGVSAPVEMVSLENEHHCPKLELHFDKAEMRDTLSYQLVVFLKSAADEVTDKEKHKCNTPGAILGYPSESWTIRADGRGSIFPLYSVSRERTDPLWYIDCLWGLDDGFLTDKFDGDAFKINININHPDCPADFKNENNGAFSPLTKSIIRDAIGTFIASLQCQSETWDAVKHTESLDKAEFKRGSVAHAAWHFYNTYQLNDQTPAALMKSCGKIKI